MSFFLYFVAILFTLVAAVFAYEQGYADPLIEMAGYVFAPIETLIFRFFILSLTFPVSTSSRPRPRLRKRSSRQRVSTPAKTFSRVSQRMYPRL